MEGVKEVEEVKEKSDCGVDFDWGTPRRVGHPGKEPKTPAWGFARGTMYRASTVTLAFEA